MSQHRTPRRRHTAYHLLVTGLLAGLVLTGCTEDDAPAEPMGPSVEEITTSPAPSPQPEPIPAEPDPAPVEPAAVESDPEPVEVVEDEPEVHTGVDRGIYGPEDCDTANTSTPMTQAEWVANCSDYEAPTTAEEEAHTDGGDGWPEGAYEPAPDECIGYGCSPEQDAAILEAEAAANAGQ